MCLWYVQEYIPFAQGFKSLARRSHCSILAPDVDIGHDDDNGDDDDKEVMAPLMMMLIQMVLMVLW